MALGNHLYDYVINNLDQYPGNYFEIGVFNGDGFARVASNYTNKHCFAIDPFIEDGYTSATSSIDRGNKLSTQKENYLNATKHLSNITLFETTSVEFVQNLTDVQINDMAISIILIDGSHHYNDVVNDYQLSIQLLQQQKNGIIIFDDLHVTDVKKAYDAFYTQYHVNIQSSDLIGNNPNSRYVKIKL